MHPNAAQPVQASPGPGDASGFFSHHGLWAPGVRLFRQLNFTPKALTITAAFLVPLGTVAWPYFQDKAAAIAFSSAEVRGVQYLRPALALSQALQQQRLVAVAAAAQLPVPLALPAPSGPVEQAMKALSEAEQVHGPALGTQSAYQALQALMAAPAPAGRAPVTEELVRRNALVAAAEELVNAAIDGSNLSLDPDLDTYYLMDGALVQMPLLLESVSRLAAGTLANAAAGAMAPPELAKSLNADEALGDLADQRLAAALKKVATQHAAFVEGLKAPQAVAPMHQFHEWVAKGESVDRTVPAGLAAVATLVPVQAQLLDKLAGRLNERIQGFEAARNLTAVVLLACLALAAYLFMCFHRVLRGGLQEVARHIQAMRDGDLTTTPRPWGRDEAAQLMLSLRDMQAALRRIVTHVRVSSDLIVGSSRQIAGGAQDLSARTEQSAASLQQSAASMAEIAATVKETAGAATGAAKLAGGSADTARHGGEIIGTMVATMQGIHAASSRIGDITTTIDGIAFQTNILALNAAIEAARAGEAGRGFAVVANEVRSLAQRSAAAAREIKGLIGDSVVQVDEGAAVVRRAGEAMQDIVQQSSRVNQALAQIAEGVDQQAQGVAETTEAVHQLDVVTQRNAALVEETAAAAAALNQQARTLAEEVAQFRLPAHA